MILTGENRRIWRKPCPTTTLSTTNPIWTDPEANPSLRGDRQTANPLVRPLNISHIQIQSYIILRVRSPGLGVTEWWSSSHVFLPLMSVVKDIVSATCSDRLSREEYYTGPIR
jgi:hypothetical protein